MSGDSVGATRSPRTQSPAVLASTCTMLTTSRARSSSSSPAGAGEGTGNLPGWTWLWLQCGAGGRDQLSLGWIPLTAAGSAFGKADANYFFIVLAFGASSLFRKKKQ